MRHRGRAVVFESIEHYKERIADPSLDVDKDCVLVLKGCGPKGYPGMAEVGNMIDSCVIERQKCRIRQRSYAVDGAHGLRRRYDDSLSLSFL